MTSTATASNYQALVDPDRHPVRLPKNLSKSVLVLSCKSAAGGVCYVYVLGTNHYSKKSQREAKAIISFLKPEVVFLECCWRRRRLLTRKNLKAPTENSLIGALKKQDTLLGALCSSRMADNKIGVIPGFEFRVAYQEAMKYGCRVVLGDRPQEITSRRTWSKLPLWEKTKIRCYFLFPPLQVLRNNFGDLRKIIKKLKDGDLLNHQVNVYSEEFPTVMETKVHERDQYMSSLLLKHASKSRSVVAVVGRGHLRGIKKYWKKPVAKDLMTVPTSKPGPATRLWNMLTNTRMIKKIKGLQSCMR